MALASETRVSSTAWAEDLAWHGLRMGLRPLQSITMAPAALFMAALAAMLLRHPDVAFYEIDRVAFLLLVIGLASRAVVTRKRVVVLERATWPMLGLTLLAVASLIEQPFDHETWALVAAKFIVPFSLFHLAALAFPEERSRRQFEVFCSLRPGIPVLHVDSFHDRRALLNFPALHSG